MFIEKSSQKVRWETCEKIVIKVFTKILLIFIILARMWHIVFDIFARIYLDIKLKLIDMS